MSEIIPAPKNPAINMSLTKPDMRLITVRKATWVNPLMKKNVLFFSEIKNQCTLEFLYYLLLKMLVDKI